VRESRSVKGKEGPVWWFEGPCGVSEVLVSLTDVHAITVFVYPIIRYRNFSKNLTFAV
jgi:hypothetical protein